MTLQTLTPNGQAILPAFLAPVSGPSEDIRFGETPSAPSEPALTLTLNSTQVAKLAGVSPSTVLKDIGRGRLADTALRAPGSRVEARVPFAEAQAYAERKAQERLAVSRKKEADRLARVARSAAREAQAQARAAESTVNQVGEVSGKVAALEAQVEGLTRNHTDILTALQTQGTALRAIALHLGIGGLE